MRKFILVAALVLVSATAQAETKRGLTVASNEATATETTNAAEAPKYAARSAAVDARAQRMKAEQAKRLAAKDPRALRAEQGKRKRGSVLARVVASLHRHGIYW
jgi:nucleoid-associated protein YgaU